MELMESLASWIWNPLLSLIYLEMGLLLLVVTRALSWRRSVAVLKGLWRTRSSKLLRDKEGKISHRAAFIAALAAGVGVGNLAGVGTAIHLGGPGALFWMWVSALLGASFRMCSTYLSIKHQPKDPKAPLFATSMLYMSQFLGKPWNRLAPILSGLILFHGVVSANLIQANSVAHAVTNELGISSFLVALVLFIAVAMVVVGGIRSILEFSVAVAPWMILIYVIAGLFVLLSSPLHTLETVYLVFKYAWQPYAIGGGVLGYTVLQTIQFGVSRGVFSHFSGIGVAPFFHGANQDHPARGAYMSAVVPLVDTLLICTITGLVILSFGHWQELTGAYLTVTAFQTGLGDVGRLVVLVCLGMFAFTTIISWAHFSERCYIYLGGDHITAFRWFFALVTFCGPFFPVAFLWSVGDVVIGLMLLVHLFPLTYIVLRKLPSILKELNEVTTF